MRLAPTLSVHLEEEGGMVDGGPVVGGGHQLLKAARVGRHRVRRQHVTLARLRLTLVLPHQVPHRVTLLSRGTRA